MTTLSSPRQVAKFLGCAVPLLTAAAGAQNRTWPESMDFGPTLQTTVEGGALCGTVEKGLVIRLGDAGAVMFDTELLRLAAAWTGGWLRLRGTAYDGSHGPMPAIRGRHIAATAARPGWAQRGGWDDPRPIPHGALPRDHGVYRGHEFAADQVIVAYRIGDMEVRESFAIEPGPVPIAVRALELGPSAADQLMVVLDVPPGAAVASAGDAADRRRARLRWQPAPVEPVELESTTGDWNSFALGGPSSADYLDAASGTGATIRFVPGFARVRGAQAGDDPAALLVPKLCDGLAAANADDWERSVWFDKRKVNGQDRDDGRLLVDLGAVVDVWRVQSFTWHSGYRSVQRYDLYGSAESAPDAAAQDPGAAGWVPIASVDSGALGYGDKHAVGVARAGGLGRFRYLLFDVRSGGAFFSEIDVFADRCRAPADVAGRAAQNAVAGLRGASGPMLEVDGGRILMRVPARNETIRCAVAMAVADDGAVAPLVARLAGGDPVPPLPSGTRFARWPEPVVTAGQRAADEGPFAVDMIAIPFDNPYGSRMRTAAVDFFRDGRAAVTTWNGDVWIVVGLDADLERIEWKRFATGLFDPLGVRIVDDVVHVHGRDGIWRLHDDDGDGEADRYECFNNDVYITPAFHEFAFDLQTDRDGNFYFSKGAPVNPGGRGFMAIVPHHGTIMRLSRDGSRLDTIATGLRAPNGIGVSPTGVVTSGDNEGTYMPRCRLNWIERPGFYAGVRDTAHRQPVPEQPDPPLCWLPMEVDNSSGGQVWVTGEGWRDLDGRLLHLSYGTCSVYLVLMERAGEVVQGGVVRLPAEFSSSCMRARFAPHDGQLYVVGLQGWQTSAAREGGFHRVRRTSAPLGLPIGLQTTRKGVYLTFAEPLDPATATDPDSYGAEIWNYRYSANYGSPEVSVLEPERQVPQGKQNRDPLPVVAARLSADRRVVFLAIDGMRPVHQMKITWNLDAADGRALRGELHHSIHVLVDDTGFPEGR